MIVPMTQPHRPARPFTVTLVASGKYHDIDFARLELLKLLAEHDRIRTRVVTDYSDIAAIAASDGVISYTCDVMPTAEQTHALRHYVAGGGKWFALHGTNSILRFLDNGLVDSPRENDALMELLGTQFVAHPPIGPYTVEVVDKSHPLSRGIDNFEVVDELYLSRRMSPFHTLMRTRFTGEATGFVEARWDTADVPLYYLRDFGSGTVLYLTLGHCRGHYDLAAFTPYYPHPERCAWNYPVYYELLRRGIRWLMGTLE